MLLRNDVKAIDEPCIQIEIPGRSEMNPDRARGLVIQSERFDAGPSIILANGSTHPASTNFEVQHSWVGLAHRGHASKRIGIVDLARHPLEFFHLNLAIDHRA
ncbi:hypothetical protein [Methylibium sp.]|uniref:hypothetical protein n=1 Tax=Methylibium sp. TaxID=2067992 RepID=UPI003340006A